MWLVFLLRGGVCQEFIMNYVVYTAKDVRVSRFMLMKKMIWGRKNSYGRYTVKWKNLFNSECSAGATSAGRKLKNYDLWKICSRLQSLDYSCASIQEEFYWQKLYIVYRSARGCYWIFPPINHGVLWHWLKIVFPYNKCLDLLGDYVQKSSRQIYVFIFIHFRLLFTEYKDWETYYWDDSALYFSFVKIIFCRKITFYKNLDSKLKFP